MITASEHPPLVEPISVEVSEELSGLIPTYLNSRREDIGRLRRALDSTDYQSIVYMAHVIRGNGAAFGFDRLSTLGGELEGAALKEDAVNVNAAVDAMASYLERVEVEYVSEAAAPHHTG